MALFIPDVSKRVIHVVLVVSPFKEVLYAFA